MQTTDTILVVLVAVVGAMVLLQSIVLLAGFMLVRKAMRAAQEQAGEFRATVLPVLEDSKQLLRKTKDLIARIEPRVESAATDVAEITRTTRVQVARIQASTDEITERVRRQAARIDGMTTSTLNNVDRVGRFVSEAVNVPMRRVSGILAAAKAIVETLRAPAPASSRPEHADHAHVRDHTTFVG